MRWQDGVENSASHQRVISYDFSGLKCLVRFEADGYLEEELGKEGKEDVSELTKRESRTRGALAIDGISVRTGGRLIPQHAILELHTWALTKGRRTMCLTLFHDSGWHKFPSS